MPIRAIAEALDLDVNWDAATSTVFISNGAPIAYTPTPTPAPVPTTREIALFNRPYIDIGNAAWFNAVGNEQNNALIPTCNLSNS